jgi:hypothetical protein
MVSSVADPVEIAAIHNIPAIIATTSHLILLNMVTSSFCPLISVDIPLKAGGLENRRQRQCYKRRKAPTPGMSYRLVIAIF